MYKLHEKVAIASAGNLITDAAAVTGEMSTALKSRMAHINIVVSADAWLEWAESPEVQVDYRITSYIRFKQESGLYQFDPDAARDTYPCPRTWGMADRFIKTVGFQSPDMLDGLSAILSDGAALEFVSFTKHYSDLPTLDQILKDPEKAKLPDTRGAQFAMSGLLSASLSTDNADKLAVYIARLPTEFQGATIIPAMTRQPSLGVVKSLQGWAMKFTRNLYSK